MLQNRQLCAVKCKVCNLQKKKKKKNSFKRQPYAKKNCMQIVVGTYP